MRFDQSFSILYSQFSKLPPEKGEVFPTKYPIATFWDHYATISTLKEKSFSLDALFLRIGADLWVRRNIIAGLRTWINVRIEAGCGEFVREELRQSFTEHETYVVALWRGGSHLPTGLSTFRYDNNAMVVGLVQITHVIYGPGKTFICWDGYEYFRMRIQALVEQNAYRHARDYLLFTRVDKRADAGAILTCFKNQFPPTPRKVSTLSPP